METWCLDANKSAPKIATMQNAKHEFSCICFRFLGKLNQQNGMLNHRFEVLERLFQNLISNLGTFVSTECILFTLMNSKQHQLRICIKNSNNDKKLLLAE